MFLNLNVILRVFNVAVLPWNLNLVLACERSDEFCLSGWGLEITVCRLVQFSHDTNAADDAHSLTHSVDSVAEREEKL